MRVLELKPAGRRPGPLSGGCDNGRAGLDRVDRSGRGRDRGTARRTGSREYVDRQWTNHERQHAQARAIKERGREYILPIKLDESELPGMPPTIGYLSLTEMGIDQIAEILLKKLRP
jgi:hypothetical protein